MRLIHTADWHLCDRLGRIDRTADLKVRVERIAGLCLEHQADLLLIAGDLFSEQATVEQMTDALRHLHRTFAAFFARGGTIVALTGNHDRDGRINLIRAGMSLVAPPTPLGGRLTSGRLYLLNGCFFGTLEARPGDAVQLVLVPYPFPARYDLSATEYRTKEEENRLLHCRVAAWVQRVVTRPGFAIRLPTVLAAHLHVRGAEVHALYRLTERDDVLFDLADLNPGWAYVALGHVHKPQALGGLSNVRYPGSLDRLDFGETHEEHGVLLVEVGSTALVREPEWLAIPATPFHSLVLADPEKELPGLAERFPDRETAIVRVTVNAAACGPGRDEIACCLRRLFPRLYEVKWLQAPDLAGEAVSASFNPRVGFATAVRDYLDSRLKDDPDRVAVQALAEQFLAEGGEA